MRRVPNLAPHEAAALSYGLSSARAKPQMAYPDDPLGFFKNVLGWEAWSLQRDIAMSVVENRRTYNAKCHASGGTALAARILLWFLKSYDNSLALTTAPIGRQVGDLLWHEVHLAYDGSKVPLGGRLYQVPRLEFGPTRRALGFATDKSVNVPGFHAENVLVIKDEAAGIPEEVQDALESACSGGFVRVLEFSQPLFPFGRFYEAFQLPDDPGWHKTFVTSYDQTPNFTGEGERYWNGLISQEWVKERREKWGTDSLLWKIRVEGQFPPLGTTQLISPEWCKLMREIPLVEVMDGPRVLGCDVAGMGRAQTVIYPRQGNRFFKPLIIPNGDPMVIAGYICRLADRWKAACIAIDSNGVGAGTASRVQELGYPVHYLNPGALAHNKRDYANRASELYAEVANMLREGELAGHMDDETRADLIRAQALIQPDGKMRIDKYGNSEEPPDMGDAFVYTQAAIDQLTPRRSSRMEAE
jgi:phage terminase large subunit